ncbi:MAG TPA: DUF1552 domain-containing protein [Gemmataceae bacterium]|nr:DUF1552 domain-containing protein [Gemmataceae bacterium]
MMGEHLRISRRTVLKGLGTAIALPMLEAMAPVVSIAGQVRKAPPLRMAFIYIPNGIHMPTWTPGALGSKFVLPETLEPLKPVQDDLLVLSGLTLDKARAHGDGPGDHARAMTAFLTGRQPRKTHGADIRAGVSADQVAAEHVGKLTRFPSLELGCDRGLNSGNCDSGYSCAYSANISWRADSSPMAMEVNPRLVFERLFGNDHLGETNASRAKRDRYQLSVLDFVMEDALRLKTKLGTPDQRKLDEYLTGVRELEVRINRADAPAAKAPGTITRPPGMPADYREHVRLLCDLLVLAYQGDLTRVATFVFANDGSNRPYPFLGVPDGHHDLSHHRGMKDKQAKLQKINHFHISQLAYLLQKMQAIREAEGNLLGNSMVVYGSGISDGNAHNHDDLPILLAGGGRGKIKGGRHIRYPKETPLTNLYLGMLDRMGVPVKSFGDSTGRLESLS